jgi:hypothetical protein
MEGHGSEWKPEHPEPEPLPSNRDGALDTEVRTYRIRVAVADKSEFDQGGAHYRPFRPAAALIADACDAAGIALPELPSADDVQSSCITTDISCSPRQLRAFVDALPEDTVVSHEEILNEQE